MNYFQALLELNPSDAREKIDPQNSPACEKMDSKPTSGANTMTNESKSRFLQSKLHNASVAPIVTAAYIGPNKDCFQVLAIAFDAVEARRLVDIHGPRGEAVLCIRLGVEPQIAWCGDAYDIEDFYR